MGRGGENLEIPSKSYQQPECDRYKGVRSPWVVPVV